MRARRSGLNLPFLGTAALSATSVPEALKLWRNAQLATCDASRAHRVGAGALLTRGARIEWVGEEAHLPPHGPPPRRCTIWRRLGDPGLIDCHTHLVFAGTRASEYAERLRGRSYEEIARAGGGILATVRAVRAASEAAAL